MRNQIKSCRQRLQIIGWNALIILSILVIGCSSPPVERNYYIIDYTPIPANPKLILSQPLPYRVEVSDSRISRVYDRSQLVFRYSHHKIEYSNTDLWAVRLSSSLPDAITSHLVKYNTFANTQREFLIERPQYEVVTVVNQIEMLRSDFYYGVNINMDIFLRQSEDMEYMVRHSFKREIEMFTDNVEVFVQQLSRIIKEEMDIFIEEVLRAFDVFTDEDAIAKEIIDEVSDDPIVVFAPIDAEREDGVTPEQFQTWLLPSPREQLLRESRRDLVGLGRVFLPAMSNPDSEPFYTLYGYDDYTNYYEKMGSSIYLKPGEYSLQYGSGSEYQRMSKELTVIRDYVHIIEPDWGGLRVRIIDENRNTLDTQYELFLLSNAESYGYGQGALEEFGDILQTWILKPGGYKIIINNYPFNTLEDFVTIDVIKGELRTLTLVVDSETNKLKGAGILDGLEGGRELRDWRFSSTVHGSFNLNRDNSINKDDPSTIFTINTQLDSRLNYDKYPYYYTAHNLIDLGISKERDQDFRNSADSFKLRNTFVYYLSRVIGLYSRADAETHLFQEYIYFPDTKNYQLETSEGDFIKRSEDRNNLRVKPSLFPLVFREGVGLNIRPVNRPRASLNFRLGFGMRQDIYNDVYRFDRVMVLDGRSYDVFREIDSSYREGIEVSVLANFHIPWNISYSTTADILIPFGDAESSSYNWENIFTIRIIRQVALDYKINLSYNKDIRDYTEIIQNIFLRITYFIY